MNNKERFYDLDFFKILFALGVIWGHTYINFFGAYDHANNIIWRFSEIEAVCVSGFFILSGIFIAHGVEKSRTDENLFTHSAAKSFNRLYYPMIFVFCIFCVIRFFKGATLSDIAAYWPTLFFMGANINGLPGYNTFWYAVCLFWVGLPLRYLLVHKKTLSVFILFPWMFFIGFSYIFSSYSTPAIHTSPKLFGFISAGLLKAFVALIFGVELYYFSQHLKKIFHTKTIYDKILCFALELCATIGIFYSISRSQCGYLRFTLYPSCFVLFSIFLAQKSVLYRFCQIKYIRGGGVNMFSNFIYMLYLSHTLII